MTAMLVNYLIFSGTILFAYGLCLGIYIGRRLKAEEKAGRKDVEAGHAGAARLSA